MPPTPLLSNRLLNASRQANVRGFASSTASRFGPIEITAELFRSVHDLSGLSYGLAIPLTAFALRTVITLPLTIYSQKKLNRRIELRPLFFYWGDIIGVQTVKLQKSRNVDLRNNKSALEETSLKVQSTVSPNYSKLTSLVASKTNEGSLQTTRMHKSSNYCSHGCTASYVHSRVLSTPSDVRMDRMV